MEIVGLILLATLSIINCINAPKTLGLSKDNPKVKTAQKLQIIFLIFAIGSFIVLSIGLDDIFSSGATDKILVIINAAIIMYFGNSLPKLQIYKNICASNTWAMGDEKIWKYAGKGFAYLSFLIGILMIILSFYFDANNVKTVCHFIWIALPSLYLLLHCSNKFRVTNIK
ncbi:hypothetical protein [Romboutsia lituseburensis]|uniref:hypothetical protein n=1 Tax=Romboutsia lituseburensis TaxID=1537 RepID=UPI00215A264C|nr:hypothetical protein [Romboutsia lituseburensis]MCR8743717.1 hypothetical protein [Romboutsia lituseburensis]